MKKNKNSNSLAFPIVFQLTQTLQTWIHVKGNFHIHYSSYYNREHDAKTDHDKINKLLHFYYISAIKRGFILYTVIIIVIDSKRQENLNKCVQILLRLSLANKMCLSRK